MRRIQLQNRYIKDVKRQKKRGLDMVRLVALVDALASGAPLPPTARPHKLVGQTTDIWDAHIAPDWILLYLIDDETVAERCPEGAGVRLSCVDGRQFEGFLERPSGMPGNPVSDAVLAAKARSCLIYGGYSRNQAGLLCERLWQLEAIDDLSELPC